MNLSEKRERDLRQQDRIGRRDGIVSSRRDTRAPSFQPARDLRSARRGDVGGGEELMKTLGILKRGVDDFGEYAMNKHVIEEEDNKAQGDLDAAAGVVDEELQQRSEGYRNALTRGRTVADFSKASREFSEKLDDVISGQTAVSLEERVGEVETMIEEFYKGAAIDPETGELRENLQSPGAMRYLAEAIQRSRPEAMQKALAKVEERFNDEAVSLFGTNIVDQAIDTGTVNLDEARSLLPDSVPPERVNDAMIASVSNAVEALRAEGRYAEAVALLGGLRGRLDTPVDPITGKVAPTGRTPKDAPKPVAKAPQGTPSVTGGRKRFMARVIAVESSGKKYAKNDRSSASGLFQFTKPTWEGLGGDWSKRFDEGEQRRLMEKLTDQNEAALKRAGVPLSEGNYYLAHFAGSAGAIKLHQRPNSSALSVLGKSVVRANPHLKGMKARDVIAWAERKMGQAAPSNIIDIDPDDALGTPSRPDLAPGKVLFDPNVDPVTAIEQSGTLTEIVGIGELDLSPAQQARINQLYKVTTAEIRREWVAELEDKRAENGSRLMLGLIGVGGVTTREDIMQSFEEGQIGDTEVASLINMFERQEDRRQAELDRAEARADRAEARAEREERKRIERQTKRGSEVIIGRMLRGEITPAQARQAALHAAPNISPEVAAGILSNVGSIAGSMERMRGESEVVRKGSERYTQQSEEAGTIIGTLKIRKSKQTEATEAYQNRIDAAHAEYMRRVIDGEDPQKVNEEIAKKLALFLNDLEDAYSVSK